MQKLERSLPSILLSFAGSIGLYCLTPLTPAIGQIAPDSTLGTESSIVTPNANVRGLPASLIEGGATRGENLFHSFSDFNVREELRVYFANPVGIENILTRVTGSNVSNILGTLGVDGTANLFLLNPNGISFGPNARLDIGGSFFASTASSFQFPDGSEFSATNPQAPPLLTINVTPGVQWGTNQPRTITNAGNLTAGQDLTFVAGNLDLQGQLVAGRDLTLQATDTVKVRDSPTSAFIASANGNLLVQGNQAVDIFALNHPTITPFVSGGNLSLVSDGIISGDAHFSSGGSFSIRSVSGGLANFVSYYDPIISASGDVDVAADYTGTSLLVEATGNIRFQGDINITGPDTNTLPAGPDTATLTTTSALILRSGQSTLAYGGANSGDMPNYGTGAVPEGITIGGDVILQPFNGVGGIVTLSAASGNVSTRLISTNGQQEDAFLDEPPYYRQIDVTGGVISLSAANGSITTGELLSYSFSVNGNAAQGGAISLTAANGSITTGELNSYSYSYSGSAGQGGAITLMAAGNINTANLSSYSSFYPDSGSLSGNGGAITLTAGGNINTANLSSYSYSFSGNGGAIALTAGGNINAANLNSYSLSPSGNGGEIALTAGGDINTANLNAGADSGNSEFFSYLISYPYSGNGGEISLRAGGNINIGNVISYSYRLHESFFVALDTNSYSGNGGKIALTAAGNINTGDVRSSSSSSFFSFSYIDSASYYSASYSGNGGEIALSAGGNINTGTLSSSSSSDSFSDASSSASAGDGGKITLTAGGNINTSGVYSSSSSSSESASSSNFYSPFSYSGNGGEIILRAAGNITTGNLYSFSYSVEGNAASGGAISLSARGGDISGQGNQSTILGSFSISEQGTGGNGGNVAIEAKNNVSNLEILTLSSSSKSGTVQVTGLGDLLLTNTDILTSKQVTIFIPFTGEFFTLDIGGEGQSGDVAVTNSGNLTFNNSSIQSDTKGSDNAGNVTISSPGLVSFINSQIISSTSSTGQAGSITLKAPVVQLDSSSSLFAQTRSSGRAGNLTLQPYDGGQTLSVFFQNGAQISASTSGAGKGGTLTVTAPESITISGNGILSATADASSTGIAGGVLLSTPLLTITNGARVLASTNSTNASATGGNLTIQAEQLNLTGKSTIDAGTTGAAPGGNLTIQPFANESTLNVNLQDGSVVSASTSGAGKGGSLIVTAPESVTLSGNGQLSVETSGAGQAGDVTLATKTLNIENGARVSATATATATSSAQGGSISANTSQINLSGTGGGLFAETQGVAPAGSLTLQPYNNGQTLRINFQDDTKISASTSSNGQGGSLIVTAPESVILSGNGQLSAETNSTGQAGSATINTRHLTVQDRAQVSASTSGTGQGGNLQVNASDSVLLNNQGSLVTESSGSGAAGDLTISTRELTLDNSAKVSTSTQSSQGGDITLQELNTLAVSNNSQISTATQTGQAGSLRVNANSNPAAWVQVSDNSRLSAQATQAGGNAGEVSLNTRQLTLENHSQISASNVSGVSEGIRLEGLDTLSVNNSLISASTETGTAGGLSVNATESVDLSGTGGLSVEATEGGIAGDLTVTTGQMSVREGAKVTVSSPSGQAGNLNISANSLSLNRGTLSAETGTSSNEGGANINLSGLEFLLMGNESLISANARGNANGGNITINSTFIIATPPTGSQGSDIVANAVFGNGGRVSLTTQGLFGIEFRPLRTPKNDITVRSEFGLTGVFQRNSPDVDPSRGLTNLPAEFVDASSQITQNCPARGSRSESSFTITGTGGLPPRPGDAFDSPFPTGTVRSLPGSSTSSNESPSAVAVTNPVELNSPTLNRSNTTNSHTPLVEAAGWMYSSKGEVILTAQAPTFTPHGSWSTPPTCD